MNKSESFFKRYWFIISMLVGIVAKLHRRRGMAGSDRS